MAQETSLKGALKQDSPRLSTVTQCLRDAAPESGPSLTLCTFMNKYVVWDDAVAVITGATSDCAGGFLELGSADSEGAFCPFYRES